MLERFEHILFDIDGVILDSIPYYGRLFRTVAETLGAPTTIPDSFYRSHIGVKIQIWMNTIVPPEHHEKMVPLFRELNTDVAGVGSFPLVHDAIPSLKRIKDAGKSISFISTKGRRSIDALIEHHSLDAIVDFTVSGDEVASFKPDPEGIERAIRHFGSSLSCFIFVGDSLHDLGAARNAGITFVGVNTGVCEEHHWVAENVSWRGSVSELMAESR